MGYNIGKDKFRLSKDSLKYLTGVLALLCFCLLAFGGIRGRERVLRQASLDEIDLVRQQLQQVLDEEPRPTDRLIAGLPANSSSDSQASSSSEQVDRLITTLKLLMGKFQSDHAPGALSEAENLQLQLGAATVANAEKRFADGLASIASQTEKGLASTDAQKLQRYSILQTRADSFYGLQDRQKALDCYQQMLRLQPDSILAMARVADCQYTLMKTQEAQVTYEGLAQSHRHRGDALLILGRSEAAGASYQKSVAIEAWLVGNVQDKHLVAQFARSLDALGNALMLEGKASSAVAEYEKAVALLKPLGDGDDQGAAELATSQYALGNALLAEGKAGLASSHYQAALLGQNRIWQKDTSIHSATALVASWVNLGNCLLSQQKLDAAASCLDKAIELRDRLSDSKTASEFALDLALAYNNRGVIRRIQGQLDAALADFGEAEKLVSQFSGQLHESGFANASRNASESPEVTLDVATGLSEKTLEIVPRARLVNQGRRKSSAVVLAMSLKNLGYIRLAQGNPQGALGDFQKAADVYGRLVEIDDEKDLAAPFARSLIPLAWLYAACPDSAVRDGRKAKDYASKACELTDWKSARPLEALAAASAEEGAFAEAVKWEEKALEYAPAGRDSDLRSKLELYRSGKPYRSVMSKAE